MLIPIDIVLFVLRDIQKFRPSIAFKIARTIGDLFCLSDVIVNFLTGYYDTTNQEVVLEPARVAR